MDCYQERVFYYWRHGLFGHVEKVCNIGLTNKPSNLFLIMYCALSKGMVRETDDAITMLSKMSQRKDLSVLYYVAIYCIESRRIIINNKKLNHMNEKVKNAMASTNPLALYYSAQITWMFGLNDLYNELIEKNGEISSIDSMVMSTLQGWAYLKDRHFKKALAIFEKVLEEKTRSFDILALYGKATCHAVLKQYSDSIQVYARILSKYDFPELLVEKCRIYILMERWDFAISVAEEIKDKLFSSLEINTIVALNSLLKSKSEQETAIVLDELVEDFLKYEKNNWFFQMKVSFVLGTMCNQSLSIIDRILKLANIAAESSNNNTLCCSVLGFIQLLAHNYVAALSTVPRTTSNNQVMNTLAIEFQARLLIDTGRYSEAQDMLDLFGMVNCPNIIAKILQAKIYRKTIFSNEKCIKPLLQALEEHMKEFYKNDIFYQEELHFELRFEQYVDFFIRYRIDAIIDALDELITYNDSVSLGPTKEIGERIIKILTPASKAVPSFSPFNYFLALLYKKNKKTDDALFIYEKLLVSSDVYRLPQCLFNAADIFFQKGQVELASSFVGEASVEDPTLMNSIDFVILKAQVTSSVRETIPFIAKLIGESQHPFSDYIKVIDLCISVDNFESASNFIKEAISQITHPSDKALVVLRQAHIFANNGNYEKAFSTLQNLKKHQKYLSAATEVEAEIYLKYLKNNSKYISTFHDYAATDPSSESFLMLGRALRRVTMFNSAIDSFKKGLNKKNPDEFLLKELIMTHVAANRFDDAVRYFTGNAHMMRASSLFSLEFIRLMVQMKRYDEAGQCISRVMQVLNQNNKLAHAGFMRLQGIIDAHAKKYANSNTNYKNSLNIYESLVQSNQPNTYTKKMKADMSNITLEIGLNFLQLQEREKAIDSFHKALEFNPENSQAVITLFDLFKSRYDSERCRKVCLDYLEIDPQNETIALLLTSVQTNDLNESIPYLAHVLDAHPTYFRALVRLVEICARSGRLNTAINYMKKAKCKDPGFYFVQGLYSTYIGNTEKAMRFYKMAMVSHRWETLAKVAIFSILTNPDRKYLWFEDQPLASSDQLQSAEKLLESISVDEQTYKILQCDLLCSQNTPQDIQRAADIYSSLIKENPGFVAASVGLARCYTKQNEFEKANGLLKFVLSGKPFHESFSYFEEAYLMRAHITESETNFNSAQHLIYLALELNMCCKKGWEMSAKVHEQRKMYPEASVAYGYCWELCDHNDPEVGYNYAYSCMKAKKYDTALIICREVMNLYPEYKDLRERVIEPSFRNIKS